MMTPMNRLLITSAMAGMAVMAGPLPWVSGQTPVAAKPPASQPASAPAPTLSNTPPSYNSTQRLPDEILNGNRRQTIVLPSEPREGDEAPEGSGGVVAKLAPEVQRLPEGYVIGARPARIKSDGDWQVAYLIPQEGMPETPPLRLLPNQYLEMIETVLADAGTTTQFLLTGRVTEFQGVNYLLVEHIAQLMPSSLATKPAPAKPSTAPAEAGNDSTASRPAGSDAAPGQATRPASDREPSAEEVIRKLMQTEPARALVIPRERVEKPAASMPAAAEKSKLPASLFEPERAPAPATPPAGDAAKEGITWSESTWLIDQLGRVVPAGGAWWSLAFENRGQEANRRPVRLLPNRLLETAIALSGGGTRGVVFSISGEVTTYRGQNYLMIRKVLVRRDMGNFR